METNNAESLENSTKNTVINKHGLLPHISLNCPKRGHAKKAQIPRKHSAIPITIYVFDSYLLSSNDGSTALVSARAKNSNKRTGSTAKCG